MDPSPTLASPVGPAPRTRTSRRRLWLAILATLALLVIVTLLAVPIWLQSDAGREMIARRLEAYVSGEIRGSMTIGRVVSISPGGIVGERIVFTDESGRTVVEADEAELALDWVALFSGRFISPRGRVRGGRVILDTVESGALSIGEAFASSHPPPAGLPVGADTLRFEGLVVSDVAIVLTVRGAPEIRARRVAGVLLLRTPENGGTLFSAEEIDGALRIEAPLPVDLTFRGGTLAYDGDAARRAVVELPTRLSGEAIAIDVVVRFDAAAGPHIDVHVVPSGVGAAIAAAPLLAQALLAEVGASALDVTVDIR